MGREASKQTLERKAVKEKKSGDPCPTPIREWAAPKDEILDAVYDDSSAARDEMFRELSMKDRTRISSALVKDGTQVSAGVGAIATAVSTLMLPLTYAALGFFSTGFLAGRLFRASYYQEKSLGRWGFTLAAVAILALGAVVSSVTLGATLLTVPFLLGGALLGYGDILYTTK